MTVKYYYFFAMVFLGFGSGCKIRANQSDLQDSSKQLSVDEILSKNNMSSPWSCLDSLSERNWPPSDISVSKKDAFILQSSHPTTNVIGGWQIRGKLDQLGGGSRPRTVALTYYDMPRLEESNSRLVFWILDNKRSQIYISKINVDQFRVGSTWVNVKLEGVTVNAGLPQQFELRLDRNKLNSIEFLTIQEWLDNRNRRPGGIYSQGRQDIPSASFETAEKFWEITEIINVVNEVIPNSLEAVSQNIAARLNLYRSQFGKKPEDDIKEAIESSYLSGLNSLAVRCRPVLLPKQLEMAKKLISDGLERGSGWSPIRD